MFYLVTKVISGKGQNLSERIFHLEADVIKTCFQVLRVIFSLLIKYGELHPQLFIFYRPYLLEGEQWKWK